MGSSSPLILEISSDEEFDFGVIRRGGDAGGGGEFGGGDYFDWLSELFGEVGGDKNVDENDASDDVVVVGEVLPKKPKKLGLDGLKLAKKETLDYKVDVAEDDDDCVILDGDPDKPVAVVKEEVDNRASGDNVDDLQIVSEKGEVACRDFPHPRHLCAKFPFDSTSHEVHCAQCHCYVCDSLAPCSHWGTGKASHDHCHASDIFKYWKTERKNMKQGENSASSLPQSVGPLAQNHITRPTIIRPCSGRSVNYNATANVFSRPTDKSSRCAIPRCPPQSQSPFPQMQGYTHNTNAASRGQRLNVGSHVASSFTPRVAFKRSRAPVTLPSSKRATTTSQFSGNISGAAHQMQQIRGALESSRQNGSSHTDRSASSPQVRFPASQIVARVKDFLSQTQSVTPRPHSNGLLRDSIQTQARPACESLTTSQPLQGLPSRPVVNSGLQNMNLARPVYPNQHLNPAPRSQSDSLYRPIAQYASGYSSIGHAQNGVGFSQNFSVGSTAVRSQVPEPEVTVQEDNSRHLSTVEGVNLQQQQQTIGLVDSSSLNLILTDACLSPESTRNDSLEFDLNNGWLLGNNSSSEEAFTVPLSPVWNMFSPEQSASLGGAYDPFDC